MTEPPPEQPQPLPLRLHPRREPFEHGLIPLQKLIFTDATQTLTSIRDKYSNLLTHTTELTLQLFPKPYRSHRNTRDWLLIPLPRFCTRIRIRLLLPNRMRWMLLSYKRLLVKGGHKDSAAVADVWPSTSAFDGFLSALTPLHMYECLVRSNSRRSMPSQSDEEAHQLSYLQKHIGNIISLWLTLWKVKAKNHWFVFLLYECFKILYYILIFFVLIKNF
ncbi:putative TBCC domain-containing protein [Helianthus annuus]|nr:putative TBCC domain-containing protein [Helianthus annuus]